MSSAVLRAIARAVPTLRRRRWPMAWKVSARLVSWRPALVSAGVIMGLIVLNTVPGAFRETSFLQTQHLVASLMPLAIALQAAFVFSPEDEPALEAVMAYPRPLALIVLERLGILLVWQGGVALAAGGLVVWVTGSANVVAALIDWIIPTLTLSGIALCITLITRQAVFGAVLAGLIWWAMLFFGDSLLAAHPYFWPLHLYLPVHHPDYALNRAIMSLLGVWLITFALDQLRDEARLLWGTSRRKAARAGRQAAVETASEPERRMMAVRMVTGFPLAWRQVGAMTVYEARMQWRRRTMLAVLSWPIVVSVLLAFVALNDLGGQGVLSTTAQATALVQHKTALALTAAAWLPLYVGLLTLPTVVADVIPKDRQLGLGDLVDTLPFTAGTYLAGKVFSVWLAVIGFLLGAMVLIGAAWWLVIGPFDVALYLRMWLGGALPLALVNSGLAVFLAAGLNTRRYAAVVGLSLTMLGIATMFTDYASPFLNGLSPARPALFRYFLREIIPALASSASLESVLWAIGVGGAEMALAWVGAWVWMRKREV
jgi:hypothetical protein